MAVRTYLPMLYTIVRLLCKYIARYNVKIRENLPSEYLTAFNAMSVACDAFNLLVGEDTPVN